MIETPMIGTGYPSLDRMLGGGLRAGDLVVLGGDAGSGTSSLALSIAIRGRAAESLFLTSEMSQERVAERALAMEARVAPGELHLPTLGETERDSVAAAATRLEYQAPTVRVLQGGGAAEVAELARELPGLRLVVVDGLEALITDPHNRDDQLAFAVLLLKRLAVALNTVLLLVTHLPRLDPRRVDRRPRLDDFGVHGAVAVHADVVLALFREELYLADMAVEGASELLLLKRRDGAPGYVDLYFYPQWLRFEEVLDAGG